MKLINYYTLGSSSPGFTIPLPSNKNSSIQEFNLKKQFINFLAKHFYDILLVSSSFFMTMIFIAKRQTKPKAQLLCYSSILLLLFMHAIGYKYV